jgi:ATP-dependent Clp protease ATP-binding subunit ClpA
VLVLAQEEARLLNHSFIGTEHILLGLLAEGEGLAAKALESLDISLEAAREKVEDTIGPAGNAATGSPPFTPRAKKVLELSLREALQLGHNYIGTEHMLLGLIREGEGVAAQVLVNLGADLPRTRQRVIQLLHGYHGEDEPASEPLGRAGPEILRGVAVGDEWTAQVVRAGRSPADYAGAYEALARLVGQHGVDLEILPAEAIRISSVSTNEGPGLRLVVRHRLEVAPAGEPEETADEQPDEEPPSDA